MQKYLDRVTPNVSNVWRADELYLKVKGNNKYLSAMMDETRFWISQQVADKKNREKVMRGLKKQDTPVAYSSDT